MIDETRTELNDTHVRKLGKYRLISRVGDGGMADVYLAVAQGIQGFSKLLVLKVLRGSLARDPDSRRMFMHEARLAARLSHPHIVQTYEVGVIEGKYVLVMEYLEGQTLHAVRKRAHDRPELLALQLRVLSDVLAGLQYAHELRDYDGTSLDLVHRDVKASNIFVCYNGQAKLLDFGIAKAHGSEPTRTGILKGTIPYMAPEAFQSKKLDRRADIYALGVLLWEAAAGRRLWAGLDTPAIMSRLVTGEIPKLREAKPDVSAEIESITEKAMAVDREERYATALELQEDIEQVLSTLSPMSHRRVKEMVNDLYAHEWTRSRSIIDQHLAELAKSYRAERASSNPPTAAETPSGMTAMGSPSASAAAAPTPSNTEIPLDVTLTAPARSWARPLMFGGGAAAVVLATWFGASALTNEDAASNRLAAEDTEANQSEGSADAPSRQVTVRMVVEPPDARVFLDDREIAEKPVRITLPQGLISHTFRVSAEGYETEQISFTAEQDTSTVVRLKPLAAAAQASPKANRSPRWRPRKRAAKSKTVSTPTPPQKRTRQNPTKMFGPELDPSNPWR